MKNKIVFLILSCIVYTSCNFFNPTKDVKEITPIKFIRFDKDLQQFDPKKFKESETTLLKKYPEIYPFYIQKLMGLGVLSPETSQEYYGNYFPEFLGGEYNALMDSFENQLFPKIPELEKDITLAYSHLIYHFPEKKAPKVFSFFVSPNGANPQAAFSYGTDTIGINWFNYMGVDFSLYNLVYEGYMYMKEWNQPSYMARNIMLVEYNNLYTQSSNLQDELIYKMVEEGKKYYFLDKVSPETKDWVKIGYSESQYKWCVENELDIWSFLKEHKLLYSLEIMDTKRYTQEGPTTTGMPKESPGMVGTWIGWQIVKKYAENSPNKTLKEILNTSAKEIVKIANYKPQK